jgi:hypothetical protein
MTIRSRVIDFHQVKGHRLPLGKYEKLGMRPVALQWAKEKGQKDKQWSAKLAHKTKAGITRTPLTNWVRLMCSGRVNSSCSTSGTRRATLAKNPVVSHE